MPGLGFVIAKYMSVEDLLKIVDLGVVASAHWQANVTYSKAGMRSTVHSFTVAVKPFHLCFLLNLMVKYVNGIFGIDANSYKVATWKWHYACRIKRGIFKT